MRNIILIIVFLLCGVSVSNAQKVKTSEINAYYFHGNFRCPTCFRIEQYSKEAVEENFKDELASGKIIFKVVNVDEKENQHFVQDYQLYTKSLIISLVKGGKEVKFKNLTKVWEYIGNKQKFFDYVRQEILDYLKEQ